MHSFRCERRKAHGDILSAFRIGSAVTDPFAPVRDNSLTSPHVQDATAMLNPQHAAQYNCELVEIGLLSRLAPSRRAAHMGNADCGSVRVHMSDVFIQE